MAFYDGPLEKVPEFVEFVSRMKGWAEEFEIYEFIVADDDGNVPPGCSILVADEFVWTERAGDEQTIESGLATGSPNYGSCVGWYLGKKPWTGFSGFLAQETVLCPECLDGVTKEPEDCTNEYCQGDGTIWIYLENEHLGIN